MTLRCLWYNGPVMCQAIEDFIEFEQGRLRYECPKCNYTAFSGGDISFQDQVLNHLMHGEHNHRMTPINQEVVERDEDFVYVNQGEDAIKTYWGCCCCVRYYQDKQQFEQHFEASHAPIDILSQAQETSSEYDSDKQEEME